MIKIAQKFEREALADPVGAVRAEIARLGVAGRVRPGMRIAVTAGSRGIANLREITAGVVDELRRMGAQPFVVPAMGSHGEATAEGQRSLLADLGISEETVGAPIVSSMEVVQLGVTPNGAPVYLSRDAYEADGIVPLNRVKAHTAFKADNESGLLKVMAVGLGKHRGAQTMHQYGLAETIPQAARIIVEKAPVLFGLAIVENAFDQTWKVAALWPQDFEEAEKQLLRESKAILPRVPFDTLDALVIEEMGKNYSGTGVDLNVIGMWRRIGGPQVPNYRRVVVLDLTPQSHGNALGIGLVDVTTRRLVNKIDFKVMYTNVITTGYLATGKVPVTMETDREAIALALQGVTPEAARFVRIKNTLHLDQMEVSEALLPEVQANPNLEVLGAPQELAFDAEGNLIRLAEGIVTR